MDSSSFFRPWLEETGKVNILFNGAQLLVPSGITVAAALLMAGVTRFRTSSVSDAPRAPLCMMGVCFECLLEINGAPNRQGCLVLVEEGMEVRTQEGAAHYE